MTEPTSPDLSRLFHPRSIAVIGASPRIGPRIQGNNYIKGSVNMNFRGKVYPVNPGAEDLLGMKVYASVRDIPDEVDLAIFTIPAEAVLPVMEDCAAKGVKFVHLFTAGFSETGREEYARIEARLLDLARESGIRIVGPNCMGVYCPEGGLAFQFFLPYAPGRVGFFSQSGQLAAYFIMKGAAQGLGFSKVVSFGNACDLKAHDFLAFLGQDEKTQVIGSYLEGLSDGQAFLQAARAVTPKKPLVVWKGGLTDGGSRATLSHTAAIAGSPRLWQALCRQAGILSVASLDDLTLTLSALQRLPLPKGRRLAVMGGAGGYSVTMTDTAEKAGLAVPHLAGETIQALEKIVPPEGASVKNPLDVGPGIYVGDTLLKIMELLRRDPNIDALIVFQPIGLLSRIMGKDVVQAMVELTIQAKDQVGKPMLLVLEQDDGYGAGRLVEEAGERYQEAGLVVCPNFELAARVMSHLAEYQTFLSACRAEQTA